jgi:hypothetical protein
MSDQTDAECRTVRGLDPTLERLAAADLQQFVREHLTDDVSRLLLGKAPPDIDLRAAAAQIRARQKARDKLPDWYATDGLVWPAPLSVEQASSTRTAAYKAGLLSGRWLVDLCGGLGADALAFAARFATVTYVERDPVLCARFAHNAGRLSDHPISVVNADAGEYLATFGGRAAFYLDPARRSGNGRVFRFADCSPSLAMLLPRLREHAERVLVKASPMLDLAAGIAELGNVVAVHVVSVDNECKELLFLIDPAAAGEPEIHCVELAGTGAPAPFRFTLAAERAAASRFAAPGRYLYDPGPTIRKAGAFKLVGQRFGLAKLAPQTHLYTAEALVPAFPGRVFEVQGEVDRHVRRALPGGRANVVVRNHPDSAEALRARLRIREGGDQYLLGCRDQRGRARLLLAHRVAG